MKNSIYIITRIIWMNYLGKIIDQFCMYEYT